MLRIKVFLIALGTFSIVSNASSFTGSLPDNGFADQPASSPINPNTYTILAGILPKDGEDMYEIEFWNSIKDSTHAEDYEAYLESYPDGRFAPLAKVRAERYRNDPASKETDTENNFTVEQMSEQLVAVANANIRNAPVSKADKINVLHKGSSVEVTGKVTGRNWYRIRLSTGRTGYVYAPLLTKSPAIKPQAAPTSQPVAPQVAAVKTTKGGTIKDCPDCPEMRIITPGTFTMGDNRGDRSERPAHTVTISTAYAIGKYEVTVGQWKACVAAGACKKATAEIMTSADAPIRDVSWDDATDYTDWLSEITDQTYRLPTEAEWEYAARAGSSTTYWWGDKMTPGKAHCKDCGNAWNRELPAQVGSFQPNPYGLHDMNGNVWEWVSDCWHRNYSGAPRDGRSWNEDGCTVRVIRSGSWRNDKTYVHSASRFKYDAYIRYLLNGFRVAKSLTGEK